jgi:predicted nucleic acid-binding protein
VKKAMIDLNVVLDVAQKREPHFVASAQVLARAQRGDCDGMLPAHAITTIHYLVQKYSGVEVADRTVDWLLASFEVAPVRTQEFLRARTLGMTDFEDAVVAAAAVTARCDVVVTRNVADFERATIRAVTPEEFLAGMGQGR